MGYNCMHDLVFFRTVLQVINYLFPSSLRTQSVLKHRSIWHSRCRICFHRMVITYSIEEDLNYCIRWWLLLMVWLHIILDGKRLHAEVRLHAVSVRKCVLHIYFPFGMGQVIVTVTSNMKIVRNFCLLLHHFLGTNIDVLITKFQMLNGNGGVMT